MKFVNRLAASAALCSVLVAGAAVADAQQLRYSVGFPTGAAPEAARVYAEAIRKYSDGALSIRVFDLSLLNLAEMSAGLAEGITDVGYVLTPYFPAEYPHVNMASELSMLLALQQDESGKGGLAFAGAIAEFVFLHCVECNADFARQKQVHTSSAASAPYALLCNKPIRNAAELQGARLRSGGAAWARWARHFGATPASMPGNEVFEALNQRVVDCAIISATELSGLNLKDAVSDITVDVPGGVFSGSTTNVNSGVWSNLSESQRKAMLRAGAVMSAQTTFRYMNYAKRDLERAQKKGVNRHDADPGLIAASREFIETDIGNIAENYSRQYGVKRADELIGALKPLVAKWSTLVERIDDADALAELYWQEIYSKVDVTKHGIVTSN